MLIPCFKFAISFVPHYLIVLYYLTICLLTLKTHINNVTYFDIECCISLLLYIFLYLKLPATSTSIFGLHYIKKLYSLFSLLSLIALCLSNVSGTKFHNMHTIALLQQSYSPGCKSAKVKVDPLLLHMVVSIQRNANGQIYTLPSQVLCTIPCLSH